MQSRAEKFVAFAFVFISLLEWIYLAYALESPAPAASSYFTPFLALHCWLVWLALFAHHRSVFFVWARCFVLVHGFFWFVGIQILVYVLAFQVLVDALKLSPAFPWIPALK